MTYFSSFPKTFQDFGNNPTIVTDIFRRSSVVKGVIGSADFYTNYSISDGQRPEDVANEIYKSPVLHWVVLIYNEIHDPFFAWPLSQSELVDYCKSVYGEITMYQTAYYKRGEYIIGEYVEYNKDDPSFAWAPPLNPGPNDPSVYPVSFIEHEETINDSRRQIKILKPEFLQEFIKQFTASINV